MAITPFKVIQGHRFWYQWKAHVYDFLLVINTNLLPILLRFRDIAFNTSEIAIFGYPSCVLCPRWRGFLHHIIVSDISLKTRRFNYISAAESLGISSTTFMHCALNGTDFADIKQVVRFAVDKLHLVGLEWRFWVQIANDGTMHFNSTRKCITMPIHYMYSSDTICVQCIPMHTWNCTCVPLVVALRSDNTVTKKEDSARV